MIGCVVAMALGLIGVPGSPVWAASTNPVSFIATVSPASAHPGEVAIVHVKASIAPGWHLYSLIPTPPPGPTQTIVTLSVPSSAGAVAGAAYEDAPTVALDQSFGKQIAFHEGHADFMVPVRIAAAAGQPKNGGSPTANIGVAIHYEVCNHTVCLPPTTMNLRAHVDITSGAVRSAYADIPPAALSAAAGASPAATPLVQSAPEGLLPFALAAFAAGLLALLTPCVFPLIPVTFGFFTKQVGADHRRMIILAGAYAIGIIVSFTVLGLLAALIFGAAGANRVAANPWFNLFFGLLFVAFALSFFESIIFQLPAGLSRFARPMGNASGLTGVLLMGLAFVFAAFTCTAPFIGTVLVAAASATGAQWVRPLTGMMCFSLALALPFFLIALFPSLLGRLPRSGGWLTRFKATLGFLELAYALTYFSKTDLVWQAHILTRPVVFALWAALSIAAALYLVGLLRVSAYPEEPAPVSPGRWVFAGVFTLAGLYCLYALTGRPVNGLLLAYLPPAGYGVGTAGQAEAASDPDAGWDSNFAHGLAIARQTGKPVFLDFTGYTCTNCRYVELNTFTKSPVKDLLNNQFTRVRLYTDGGRDGAANQALQQREFGTVALPLYAVVAPNGKAVAQLSGSNSSVSDFAAFMQHGLQLAQAAPAPSAPSGSPASGRPAAWSPYSANALAQARAAGRPVIVDFTASWCVNCHALEKNVFTAPPVAAKLGGFTTLRADLTDFYGPANAAVEKQYAIAALPAVLFLDPSGHEVAGTRVTGLVSPDEFAGRMTKAVARG